MESVDVRALAALLSPEEDDSDDDTKHTGLTPADLGNSSSIKMTTTQVTGSTNSNTNQGIPWSVEDDRAESDAIMTPDPRPEPHYQITFRQRLTPNQVYLPISLGESEEDLVVRVDLPGDLFTEVTLEVTGAALTLTSPSHHLHLPLPRPVDQRKGVATWDPTSHTLVVTLPTVRPSL